MKQALRPILLLVLAAFLPICAFAAATAYVSYRQERAAVEQDALERVRELTLLIDRELGAQMALMQTLAALPEFDSGDLAAIDRTLRRIEGQQPLWLAALLADPQGMIVVDTQLRAPYPVVDKTSLQAAIDTRRPVIGSAFMGLTQVAFAIRAPVIREGQVRYVLSAVIRPDAVHKLLFESTIPAAWVGAVVDAGGSIVARTREEEQFLGKPASAAVQGARARGGDGFYEGTTLEGEEVVTAYRISPTTGWSVHLGIPRAIYEAPIRRWLWVIVAGALGALVLAAALFGLLIREMAARRNQSLALERARRMESLGRLTGGIAHDFNNLLTAVLGGVTLIRRRANAPLAAPYLDAIERAVERGTQVTADLLSFARGGGAPAKVIALDERIRGLIGMLGQTLRPDIAVTLDLGADGAHVKIDPVQFDLALLNLAANARDAMPGPGKLTIATRLESGGARSEAVVRVTDTGTGISEEHLPYVFEPFFTTKDQAKGSGLGLAQVYGLTTNSGGAATIQSRLGQGTTVTLRLPAVAGEAAPEAKIGSDQPAPAGARGRVLLVDDNADVRAALAEYLREVGFEVHEAADAVQALAELAVRSFAIMVSDILMPGGRNGIDLAREARRRWPALPIILISGYSASASQAMNEGWTVLPKPFNFDRLEAAINEARAAAKSGPVAVT